MATLKGGLMALEIGNIVTVTLPGCRFNAHQGLVVEIKNDGNEDGSIGVKFGHSSRYLFNYPDSPEETTIWFTVTELRVEQTWNAEIRAKNLYGRNGMYHSLHAMREVFNSQVHYCMHNDHRDKQKVPPTRTILINHWGTVYEFPACKEHEKEDGRCVDVVPFSFNVECAA